MSGASPGQLQHEVASALQELTSSSSDAEFVNKALALSKAAAAAAPCSTSGSGGFIAAGRGSSKLASVNLEGADLFELAAAATGPDGQLTSTAQHGMSAGSEALESLEELAAAMNGILADRP